MQNNRRNPELRRRVIALERRVAALELQVGRLTVSSEVEEPSVVKELAEHTRTYHKIHLGQIDPGRQVRIGLYSSEDDDIQAEWPPKSLWNRVITASVTEDQALRLIENVAFGRPDRVRGAEDDDAFRRNVLSPGTKFLLGMVYESDDDMSRRLEPELTMNTEAALEVNGTIVDTGMLAGEVWVDGIPMFDEPGGEPLLS